MKCIDALAWVIGMTVIIVVISIVILCIGAAAAQFLVRGLA